MKIFEKNGLRIVCLFILFLLVSIFPFQMVNAKEKAPKLRHGWKRHIRSGKLFTFKREEFSSPTIADGVVYVGSTRGRVYAFKLKNGRTLWKWEASGPVESSPAVADGKVYVGDSEGYLNCLDGQTGELIWSYNNTAEIISKPVVEDGKVFYSTLGNQIVALDASTGEWIWHYKSPFSERLNVRLDSSSVVVGNWVHAGFTNGFLVALSTSDGKEIWARPLGRHGQLLLGITTPVVVGDDLLVTANYGRTLYAVNRKTGEIKWVSSGYGISKVASDGSRVYYTSLDGKLAAVEMTNGYIIWEQQFDDPPLTAPIIIDGYIALGDKEGRMFIVDAKDGEIVRKKNPYFDTSGFSATPAFQNDRLIFYSDHGRVYCKKVKF